MAKVRFTVRTNMNGSDVSAVLEIDLDDVKTEEERDKILADELDSWVWSNIDAWWEEVEEDE